MSPNQDPRLERINPGVIVELMNQIRAHHTESLAYLDIILSELGGPHKSGKDEPSTATSAIAAGFFPEIEQQLINEQARAYEILTQLKGLLRSLSPADKSSAPMSASQEIWGSRGRTLSDIMADSLSKELS